ncbi:MAG: membrane protein insertase YidC [Gammaproteobacteria bacterium]|nr:membrane protein insertase YidC [Gammaproteobacteria bacterium]
MNIQEIIRYGLLLALGICAYLLVMQWTADYGGAEPPKIAEDPLPQQMQDADAADERGLDAVPTPSAETGDVPDASLVRRSQAEPITAGQTSQDSDLVTVRTPLVTMKIDPIGGDIRHIALHQHPISLEYADVPTILLQKQGGRTYIAQSGLVGEDGFDASPSKPRYSVSQLDFDVVDTPRDIVLSTTRSTEAGDIVVRKIFTVDPQQYLVTVRHEVDNRSNAPFIANLFAQLTHDGKREESTGFLGPRPYLGAALTTNDTRYEKIGFDDVDEERFRQEVDGGWIAILQHYFLSTWVVGDDANYLYYGMRDSTGKYRFGLTGPEVIVYPGDTGEYSLRFYSGPKTQQTLDAIADNLELTVDYGFLWFLSLPLFWVLEFAHGLVGNWGVAIILLTVVVKLLLYPLSAMSYKSMARMRTVAPQIKRIQERFGNDRQRMSQEVMALYRKEKANPMTGCLPMLAQMPVFLALYWVLYESVELRQAPFFLWIQDLSIMDPYFVLPILMGASMFLMQMLNPPMPDPMQQKMMKIMPVLFTVLFVFFPAGLVLYWLMNNVLSYAQQFYVTKQIERAAANKSAVSK